jgi:hypothetical protein
MGVTRGDAGEFDGLVGGLQAPVADAEPSGRGDAVAGEQVADVARTGDHGDRIEPPVPRDLAQSGGQTDGREPA